MVDKVKRDLVVKQLEDEARDHHTKKLSQAEAREEGEQKLGKVKRRKLGLDYDESDEEEVEDDTANDTVKREVNIWTKL